MNVTERFDLLRVEESWSGAKERETPRSFSYSPPVGQGNKVLRKKERSTVRRKGGLFHTGAELGRRQFWNSGWQHNVSHLLSPTSHLPSPTFKSSCEATIQEEWTLHLYRPVTAAPKRKTGRASGHQDAQCAAHPKETTVQGWRTSCPVNDT